MPEPNIYFVGSRWRNGERKWGVTPMRSIFWRTCPVPMRLFCACDVVETDEELDIRFIENCNDGLVLIEYGKRSPSPEALFEVAHRARIVSIWPDSHNADIRSTVGFPVSLDAVRFWFHPLPMAIAHEPSVRDIDVLFSGQLEGERMELRDLLPLPIRSVIRAGWWSEDCMKESEYLALVRRAKIVVNFSRARNAPNIHQLKGRVEEAMYCGAMVLESANPVTRRWFTPGVHYAEFEPGSLAERVMHYFAHEAERARIAAAGEQHMRRLGAEFWPALFNACTQPQKMAA